MAYKERLRLPWWWWLGGVVLGASVGGAILAYVPWQAGVAIVALFLVAIGVVLYGYGRAEIVVDQHRLTAGRAHIDGQWITGAEPFDGTDAQRALGPGADNRDFLLTRPYISGLVRVTLDDAADPHPHWLISTRHPESFASAVNTMAKGAA